MTESSHVIESQEYEEVPEEVVETSYMCGECFLLFPTTEDFNRHQCHITQVESVGTEESEKEPSPSCVTTGVWETGESEAAMEEAVASILGERMKRMAAPQKSNRSPELKQTLIISDESAIKCQIDPAVQPTGDHTEQFNVSMQVEGVEIPSTNLYVYDNASYLHKLMKDNTFGRRVRHDAPYTHRLGPWDNKSSRLLIQLLKEYPKAYFILDKEMKRTEAWEIIRLRLVEAGYQFTVLQIRMRWRELCKKYRNTVNHNDLHNTRKTCQYFDDLNNLFGVWDKGATLLLIRQLDTNCRKGLGQNGGTRMRIRVWEHIRQVLAANGYQYTPDQVQGRWSNLVTLYQRMIEHNSKPHNEPITVAFKEHIERIFNYVPERNSKWLKIMEKRGKTPKTLTKRWTLPVERILLAGYQDRVYRFNNELVNNNELWQEIVKKLEQEGGYRSSVEKVRTRFYELTKQFSSTEQHNSQPGTIRRECRHHHTISQIYSIYNYWPHDKSTIKMENSNAIRMRQVNAQLGWSEAESRTLLQLYPQVLVAHLSSGEHQPIEELWLQLAKAFMSTQNEKKQCYELEEHLWLLRRGHHSPNPFPFTTEMQLVEETEATLGFTAWQMGPDEKQVGAGRHQLVPYWSHTAAHLLLDLLLHFRQEGVRNAALFEMISRDMAGYGYRYTGEECRTYYTLLRQLYTNRLRTIKRNKELIKPFPYMEKMAEVDAIVSQPKFIETEEKQQVIVKIAQEKVEGLRTGLEEGGGGCSREHLVNWLTSLKMALKRVGLHPPPPIKSLTRILLSAVESPSDGQESAYLITLLGPHLKLLHSIAERGGSFVVYQPAVIRSKGRKATAKNAYQKYSIVQWNEDNLSIMLNTVKEWKLLCHDDVEFEDVLGNAELMWKEVASRVKEHSKVDPHKCQERFNQLCREYRSAVVFNARLGSEESVKSVPCQEVLEVILMPFTCHEAELDSRDEWWASEESGDWRRQETVNLLFTVREFWPDIPKTGWEMVSTLMASSGYHREGEVCQSKFEQLYQGYEAALHHNRYCGLRTRRRPPFYYKMHALFSRASHTQPPNVEICGGSEVEIEERSVMCALVDGLRQIKHHHCHTLPRLPLLNALARHLNDYFQCSPPAYSCYKVWQLMVDLHHSHIERKKNGMEMLDDTNLGELWQDQDNPVVAYGLHAQYYPGWQKVSEWSAEEVYYLLEAIISWELKPRSSDTPITNTATNASNTLKVHGQNKTPLQCQDQWLYMIATFRLGGYRQFIDQLKLLYLISPSLQQSYQSQLSYPVQNSKVNLHKAETPHIRIQAGEHQSECKEHRTVKHCTKGMKLDLKDPAILTVSEEDWERKRVKNNAPGDVISYVQINVPWKAKPNKRHVQVATDELECINSCGDGEEALETSLKVKHEPLSDTSTSKFISVTDKVKHSYIKRQKGAAEKEVQHVYSKNAATTFSKSSFDSGGKQNDRVQVEILSITESENSKVVECRTVKGTLPARTIRLHYPSDHPLPTGLKYMNIPMIMVYPDIMATGQEIKLLQPSEEIQCLPCNLSPQTLKQEVEDMEASEHDLESPEFGGKVDGSHNPEEGKGEILQLLSKYRLECHEDGKRWLTILQDNHQQQISSFEQSLFLFKAFQDCL